MLTAPSNLVCQAFATLVCFVWSLCVFYAYLALGRHRCKLQLGWCASALIVLCVGGEQSSLLPHLVVPSWCNSCNVGTGDRLISVNDVDLQGLSHSTTVDILQNAPDDVTLVVSQPKERLYKGEGSITSVSTCKMFLVITYRVYLLQHPCFLSCSDRIFFRLCSLSSQVRFESP